MIHNDTHLRRMSPLPARNSGPTPPPPPPPRDEDKVLFHGRARMFVPVGAAALLSLCAVAAVHVQPAPASLVQQTYAERLDEASVKQGIGLEFQVQNPDGTARSVDGWTAETILAEGGRVTVAELTRDDGPVRSPEPRTIRREAELEDTRDLDAYTRYFTNGKPQNATESAAAKLKKHVYSSPTLTVLSSDQAPTSPATLSPFAAARRLAQGESVIVRSFDEMSAVAGELRLDNLEQVGELVDGPMCNIAGDPAGYQSTSPVWCLY